MTEIAPRLWWNGRAGVARIGDVQLTLRAAPPVAPELAEIDYAPALGTALVRTGFGALRDMTPAEIEHAEEVLAALSAAAARAFEAPGNAPLEAASPRGA